MKPGFILIIGILWVCLSFESVLGGEAKKLCPDPNLKYETWSGERYWEDFVDSHLSEIVRTNKFLCATFEDQTIDFLYVYRVIIPIKDIENREAKETGLLSGIRDIFGSFKNAGKEFKKYKSLWVQVVEKFSNDYVPMMESFTGLKFKTADEWFDWWEVNKDHLVLSEDGKYLVVK